MVSSPRLLWLKEDASQDTVGHCSQVMAIAAVIERGKVGEHVTPITNTIVGSSQGKHLQVM